jgi:hypothetical protein
VESITKDTNGHTGTSDVRELDGTRETLITLGIVVLQTNLEFDSFGELTRLLGGSGLDLTDDISDGRIADLAI